MNTPADRALLESIKVSTDDRQTVRLIHEYWHDMDRSERTPRSYLYLHLGILVGMTWRLLQMPSTVVH